MLLLQPEKRGPTTNLGARGPVYCLVVCLVLSGVYSFKNLKNLKDLINEAEKVNFGKSPPRAGLLLLCWLLGQGKIDNNGKLLLNFDPSHQLYGFHQYKNYDKTFPVLSNTNYAYYSLGNLNTECARAQLPEFISQDFKDYPRHPQRNIDRILIRVDTRNPRVVDEVYITQHHEDRSKGTDYDINLTYKLSTELLKEIEELCNPDKSDNKKHDKEDPDNQRFRRIKSKFANDPPLRFLYEADYDTRNEKKQHPKSGSYRGYRRLELKGTSLELKRMPTGNARIMWNGISDDMMESDPIVYIYYRNEETPLVEYPLDGRKCGFVDTAVTQTPGLQIGLKKAIDIFESEDSNWVSPTPLKGHEASVQLFVKNDHASARLYVKKSFADWKDVFQNSWVGLYPNNQADKHETYQWVHKFVKTDPLEEFVSENYDVYEYESDLSMSAGVQARFMLDKDVASERARTVAWEGAVGEVPPPFFTWTKLLVTLFVVIVLGLYASHRPQKGPAPHFVQVSHGRPG